AGQVVFPLRSVVGDGDGPLGDPLGDARGLVEQVLQDGGVADQVGVFGQDVRHGRGEALAAGHLGAQFGGELLVGGGVAGQAGRFGLHDDAFLLRFRPRVGDGLGLTVVWAGFAGSLVPVVEQVVGRPVERDPVPARAGDGDVLLVGG